MSKVLTIYYSRKGENYFGGSIKSIAKGNTEIVAEFIQQAVGGDLFEVETVKTYSTDYNACTLEAKAEKQKGERVAVKQYKDDLENYDVIFVGYPNWWGTMPMVMFTFLENYNLSGKKIIPFCTNEGSGMGVSEKDLLNICTGATMAKGLAIIGSDAMNSKSKVSEWAIKSIK